MVAALPRWRCCLLGNVDLSGGGALDGPAPGSPSDAPERELRSTAPISSIGLNSLLRLALSPCDLCIRSPLLHKRCNVPPCSIIHKPSSSLHGNVSEECKDQADLRASVNPSVEDPMLIASCACIHVKVLDAHLSLQLERYPPWMTELPLRKTCK